ncbi:MAG TPA: methylmalonyl-CoA mutase family protein, partial [Salinimicrobium sp.]|nr:methylmalonyl-CoA mutase family protein [Salinimicrobium sp.]
NVNLLRTTTESMSAVIGGADFVSNLAYDEFYHKSNEFSSRIAKNQLLILKNESYLDQVNPADGTYYLEELTQQFSEKALEIFKGIEKGGGFLKQLKEGIIQKKIAESAAKEQQQVESGEMTLVGTNKYIHPQDLMKGETEIYPFLKHNPRKTLIRPIIPKRLSEKTEKQRMAKEQ